MPKNARLALAVALLTATTTVTATTASAAPVTAPPITAPASAAPVAGPTALADDPCLGQCHDIVPPGQSGNATLADILAHKVFGTRPAHSADQLGKYDALASGHKGLTNAQLTNFFNDASFGVPANQVESTISPRADVTIVRDKLIGMPHITGTTRSGTQFGAGYAAAQDRLWLMDLFRHLGRGQLSGFAGGAEGNRVLEQSFVKQIAYTEADLQAQIDRVAAQGDRGRQAFQDVTDYLQGVNAYITQAIANRNFPGEYVLTGHADAITNWNDIQPFKATDLVAIAAVVGGLFGAGGGGEVQNALVRLAAQNKYGAEAGDRVWRSFRARNDPEATLTLHDGQRFPYATEPANPKGVALPDGGVVTPEPIVYDQTTSGARQSTVDTPDDLKALEGIFADGVLPKDLLSRPRGMSNAVAISGAHTTTGNPIAVWGPQTGYFAPQLLMLQELNGPGLRARGVSFAGVNMYVQLGRGLDYSWSATSSGQDITDTYAVELCEPNGQPTANSAHYLLRGQCVPMERLERKNAWKSTVADPTPAGSYTLVVYRTKYGLVQSRAKVGGKFVAYTALRSTYLREVDPIIGFQEFNDPGAITSAQAFQRAAERVGYAFNWFYADANDIAYFNSGLNPVRKADVDPDLPVKAEQAYEWQNWNPDDNSASYTTFAQHPQSVNQDFYVSWNNKQALDHSSGGYGMSSVHRGDLLDKRVRALIANGAKVDRAAVTKAVAEAGLADLRAERVLPEVLRVLGTVADADLAPTVQKLRAWVTSGSLRTETSKGSKTYAHADAIRVLDAWWPLLVDAQFRPGLGDALNSALVGALQVDEAPSDPRGVQQHKGSAFQYGWWGFAQKDLRAVLGDQVAGPLGAKYCGGGDLARCRQVLLDSLRQAIAVPATTTYPGDDSCAAGDQWCADSIVHRAMGGITQDKITWQNRPTYQQVVQFPSRRSASVFGSAHSVEVFQNDVEWPSLRAE
ncbi:penicillin acylase family protein [Actinosynnema sp.]|uniref:penicillin acylase family protein n=1 Tax=Actinosynnema sp. TaxID=1872144 RepID=UPI003F87C088